MVKVRNKEYDPLTPSHTHTHKKLNDITHEEAGISSQVNDKYIEILHYSIRLSVKVLSALMTFVIIWGLVDVVYILYTRLLSPPVYILGLADIPAVFGGFMTVLIAIEIFINITLYLRDDVIHVKLVIATALMAVARKVIILDLKSISHHYYYSIASLVLALGVTYWLISRKLNK